MLESLYKGRGQWQLGSLTHAINMEAMGYIALPDFPRVAPDPSARDVEDNSWGKPVAGSKKKKKERGFYEEDSEDSEEGSSSGSDFYSSISGTDESGSEDSETDSEGGSGWVGRREEGGREGGK